MVLTIFKSLTVPTDACAVVGPMLSTDVAAFAVAPFSSCGRYRWGSPQWPRQPCPSDSLDRRYRVDIRTARVTKAPLTLLRYVSSAPWNRIPNRAW